VFNKLCIIGVGLIGGSIARASKGNQLCKEIVGVGRNIENLQKAVELGVIDHYETDIEQAVQGADLVVICSPVGSFQSIFSALKPHWSADCLYTDVGSTKASVVESLASVFDVVPDNFVPAHPIAGAENTGVIASKVDLFNGKRSIITPLQQTSDSAVKQCHEWWQKMGARTSEMSVQHHDVVLGATSHLPHVLAFSLVELLKHKDDEYEIFEYAAGGFKDFTRIASSDPQMWADICIANADKILPLMKDYQQLNAKIAGMIQSEDKQALLDIFSSAQAAREDYLEQAKQHKSN